MYSFDHYSDFPQQQTNFLPNLHNSSSPCDLSYGRMNPFHQYQNHLPSQMGNFLPQTLHQDSNPKFTPPNNDHQNTYSNFPYHPSAPYEIFAYNQASLGQSSPKKDRHTKISTAQGVRDRRVRLSMPIAREFFDLQDMLGFDKASNTIEWLLAKSKGAIQELILKKRGSGLTRSNSSSSSSYEEEIFRRRRKRSRPLARRGSSSCKSLASDNYSQEEIEKIIVENQVNCSVARENRAEAGARARERTKEKLCTMAKPIQFDDLGLQTSGKAGCSSQFVMDNEGCNAPPQNLNGLNVIRSQDSSPSISCTDYLQNLLSSSSTGDQDGSVRVSHPPNLLLGRNYNPEASATMCSSFFELEHQHLSNRNAHEW